MSRHNTKSLGTLGLLALAAVGLCQESTPPAEPPQEEERIPVKWNEITVGYDTFKAKRGLYQYARPSAGFALHSLRLLMPTTENGTYLNLVAKGMPTEDTLIQGTFAFNRGRTVVRGKRTDHEFEVLDWRPTGKSGDQETEITVDHEITPSFGGYFAYRENRRDNRYPAPREAELTKTRHIAGGIGGSVLGGQATISASERRTTDETQFQPTTMQRKVEATFGRDFGNALSLEGKAGYARIEQAGLASSTIRTLALSGAYDLSPVTGIQFNFGRQDLDLNAIQNAYVRKRLVSSVRLMHRWPGWNFQVGFKHRESERVRKDQAFADVPKSNDYEARLSGRVGVARVTLRGTWEDLTASALMQTNDQRQMLWDDRTMFQAKVDCGGERFASYTTYTYRFQQNRQRGVEIGWHNIAVGGSYLFSDSISGYAEFAYDNFRVVGGSETGQDLDFYFPNSRSASGGLNWTLDSLSSASAGVNYFESGDVRGTQLMLTYRRALPKDQAIEVAVSPWRQDDRLYNLTGYKTTFLSVRFSVRF